MFFDSIYGSLTNSCEIWDPEVIDFQHRDLDLSVYCSISQRLAWLVFDIIRRLSMLRLNQFKLELHKITETSSRLVCSKNKICRSNLKTKIADKS